MKQSTCRLIKKLNYFWKQDFLNQTGTVRIVRVVALAMPLLVCSAIGQTTHFDFGAAGTEAGYVAVGETTAYSAGLGYGWVSTTGLQLRDRGAADVLRRDFIFTNTSSENTFRVSGLTPNGKYLMKVLCGDADYGDHVITVSVSGAGTLPTLSPHTAEYLELSATVDADASGILNIAFGSPTPNWVVNALTLESATTDITPAVESSFVNEWDSTVFATNPTTTLLAGFDGTGAIGFSDTGLTRSNYLDLIETEIDFWKTKQDSNGAIIDPYTSNEIQYSTPAFANAAAVLVVYGGRTDLLEPAALAMDWASYRLSINAGANGHDDFYPGMLANGYRLLSPLVSSARAATWASNLDFDPWAIYDYAPGSFNWTVVSSCGDALLQLLGIRPSSSSYVSVCWAAQGRHFTSPYGLYMEGPMAYDHFPRIWWEDALAKGYNGPYSTEVSEAMDRAAIASLFMQSSSGELPAGGRSAHHQWNEAEQCVTYEIYAAKAKAEGNLLMAAAYKRGAHLALASMQRWVRPSGEMQIVKNWVDPASRHGYEGYSYHSQYNILPMAMLAIAYEHAATTEDVSEGAAPADTGGFMFQVAGLNKVFANAGGTYVELDTSADHHYDATGLIRVHQKGISPQLGPSDSLLSTAGYHSPNAAPITTGVGVSWLDSNGTTWHTLGEMGSTEITSVTVTPVSQSTTQVVFDVTYAGNLPNVTSITEQYTVTPDGVELTTQVSGYTGALRYVWPVLSTDGKTQSSISVDGNTLLVSQGGTAAAFTASGAESVRVESDEYSNHNGWARLGFAEYPTGGAITLLISTEETDVNILSASPTGEVSGSTPTLEVVIEDNYVTVDPNQVVLLLDGSPVTADSISKVGTTTTVSYVSAPLMVGSHTAGVIAGPSTKTNGWTFSISPLPPVPITGITYVDATDDVSGNTTLADGSILIANDGTGGTTWRQRDNAAFGSNGTIFEGYDNEAIIKTTISGLTVGQEYSVLVFFSEKDGSTTEKWNVQAGFSTTNLIQFGNPTDAIPGATAAVKHDTLTYDNFPGFPSSTSYPAYAGLVGSATADVNGEIAVYIDSYDSGGVNYRTWYDGVGYQKLSATTPTNIAVAVSNETVTVSWPETHKGWMLQSSTNLAAGFWVDVSGSTSNTSWAIPGAGIGSSEFFRLNYPIN